MFLWLQATAQMEERLLEIITHCSPESSLPFADGVLGFIQHQLVELVRDCLDKSQRGLVTSMYFAELQEKLEKLLHEVRTRTADVFTLAKMPSMLASIIASNVYNRPNLFLHFDFKHQLIGFHM